MSPESILILESLSLQVADRVLCESVSLSLEPGQSLGILGRNGTGKTTLLHTLARLQRPRSGSITLAGKPLASWPQRELAQTVGILFQSISDEMPASVMELVLMGRHPHSSGFWEDSEEDRQHARAALSAMDMADFAERKIATLSGGERQRVALAMLLSQMPRLYLLDEPSNHLDIAFQIRGLEVFSQRVKTSGAALCMATHDINLAARFCDNILLLVGDGEHLYGSAEEVLTEDNLARAFGCGIRMIQDATARVYFPA